LPIGGCRLGIDDAIPDHLAFSGVRNDRFRAGNVFRRVYERVVEASELPIHIINCQAIRNRRQFSSRLLTRSNPQALEFLSDRAYRAKKKEWRGLMTAFGKRRPEESVFARHCDRLRDRIDPALSYRCEGCIEWTTSHSN
jgi:hypothetical protein